MPRQQIEYNPCNDYYAVLEAWPDASQAELHDAYREAVKKSHPDAGGDPSGRAVCAIYEAYSVLGDPLKRACYNGSRNRFGQPWVCAEGLPRRPRRRPIRRWFAAATTALGALLGMLLFAAAVAGVRREFAGPPPAAQNTPARESTDPGAQRSAAVTFGYATPFEPSDAP